MLIIVGIIAGYLTTTGNAKAALLVTMVGLVIKAVFSEINNQQTGTATQAPTPTEEQGT